MRERDSDLYSYIDKGRIKILLEGEKACPCPKHRGARLPMKEFGFRQMKRGGVIRPQSYCKESRTIHRYRTTARP